MKIVLAAEIVHAFLCEAMPENCILYSSLENADSNKFARNTVLTNLKEHLTRARTWHFRLEYSTYQEIKPFIKK